MRKAFRQIPEPLQRQILYRLGWGAAVLLLTIVLLSYTAELYSVLFCTAVIIFCVVSAFMLFRRAVIGDYVVISGICSEVAVTPVKKRTKMITLRTEDGRTLKVMIKQRLKKAKPGDMIILYVATEMPIHESDGEPLIYSYLTLEAKGVEKIG